MHLLNDNVGYIASMIYAAKLASRAKLTGSSEMKELERIAKECIDEALMMEEIRLRRIK